MEIMCSDKRKDHGSQMIILRLGRQLERVFQVLPSSVIQSALEMQRFSDATHLDRKISGETNASTT